MHSSGQDMIMDGLKDSKWTSAVQVDDFTLGGLREIGITQLRSPLNSIKTDVSIWTFTDSEIWIQSYTTEKGLDQTMVKCSYQYNAEKRELSVFHFSQDSTIWHYSLAITSSGSFVLMTRNKLE